MSINKPTSVEEETQLPSAATDANPSPSTAKNSARLKWVIRLLLGITVIWILMHQRSGDSVREVLQTVSWQVLLAAVVFYWICQLLSVTKWQMLLRAQGAKIQFKECCRIYLIGMFWNLWMPTNIGGDAIRVYLTSPHCGGKAIATSSILVERLTGFVALIAIGVLGLILGSIQHVQNQQGYRTVATVGGLLIGFTCVLLVARLVVYRLDARESSHRLINKWASLHRALDYYARKEHRRTILMSLLLSFIFQASHVLLNTGLAEAVGLHIPRLTFWWLVPVLAIASLLPVGVGGLGVREAAAVGLLQGTGASTGTIIAWSLLWQVTVWLTSLPGALWSLKGRQPQPQKEDTEGSIL